MAQENQAQFALDARSGVPFYRQIIDQVLASIATRTLTTGDRLPTVRQLAVDLAVNFNTVARAYKELEIRGVLNTQQGTGTFVAKQVISMDEVERQRQLNQFLDEFLAKAARQGLSLAEIRQALDERAGG
jgi:GntR family transcriptional regulator